MAKSKLFTQKNNKHGEGEGKGQGKLEYKYKLEYEAKTEAAAHAAARPTNTPRHRMLIVALAALVALSVAFALSRTGVAFSAQDETLACTAETSLHIHTDECYDADGELACDLADNADHTHTQDCVAASSTDQATEAESESSEAESTPEAPSSTDTQSESDTTEEISSTTQNNPSITTQNQEQIQQNLTTAVQANTPTLYTQAAALMTTQAAPQSVINYLKHADVVSDVETPQGVTFTNDLSLSNYDEAGSGYTLAVHATVPDDAYYKDVQGDTNTLLTGENLYIAISLSTIGDINHNTKLYVNFDMDAGSNFVDTSQTLNTFCGYPLDTELEFTNDFGNVLNFKITKATDLRYTMEIYNIDSGATLSMYYSGGFANKTSGGKLNISLADSTESTPAQVCSTEWVIIPDEYYLDTTSNEYDCSMLSSYNNTWSVYLDYMYLVASKKTVNTMAETKGADVIGAATYSVKLDLPDCVEWSEDVIEALKSGNISYDDDDRYNSDYEGCIVDFGRDQWYGWYDYSTIGFYTKTKGGTYNEIARIEGYYPYGYFDYASNYYDCEKASFIPKESTIKLVDGCIVLEWKFDNYNITDFSEMTTLVKYDSNSLTLDVDKLKESTQTKEENGIEKAYAKLDFIAETQITYSGAYSLATGETQDSYTTSIEVAQDLQFTQKKDTKKEDTTKYNNEDVTYTIDILNNSPLIYPDCAQVGKTLHQNMYIKPTNMENMLQDSTNGKNLTIYISNVQICNKSKEEVTNVYGEKVTINNYLSGEDSIYPDYMKDIIELQDHCKVTSNAAMQISWSDEQDCIQIKLTNYDGAGSAKVINIGEGGDYNTIEEAFEDLGVVIISSTAYECRWTRENKVFEPLETAQYKVLESVKPLLSTLSTDKSRTSLSTSKLSITDYANIYNSDGIQAQSAGANLYVAKKEDISQTAYINGSYVSSSKSVDIDDVVNYSISWTGLYSNTPIVARISGGQVLLVESNDINDKILGGLGLTTKNNNEKTYYILNKIGTYSGLVFNGKISDSVTIANAGDMGLSAVIKWYTPSSSTSWVISYNALADPQYTKIDNTMQYTLCAEAWYGDHETHRVYDEDHYRGIVVSVDEYIVSNADAGIENAHNPADDTLSTTKWISEGSSVTYRLDLTAAKEVSFNMHSVSSTLPGSIKNSWTKNNVSVRYVPASGATYTFSSSKGDEYSLWSLSSGYVGSSGQTRQELNWDSSLQITLNGTLYIYVTCIYPDTSVDFIGDVTWDSYIDAYASYYFTSPLSGYADFAGQQSYHTVKHALSVPVEGIIQKSVLFTGSLNSRDSNVVGTYNINTDESRDLYYSNDVSGKGMVSYVITVYNSGKGRMKIEEIQDILPEGFTYAGPITTFTVNEYSINSNSYYNFVNVFDNNYGENAAYTTKSFTAKDISGKSSYTWKESYSSWYLNPGCALVIAYSCYTNGYSDTQDVATSYAAMRVSNPSGTEYSLSQNVDITMNPEYTPASITQNLGTSDLVSAAEAAALGINTSGGSANTMWYTSGVTLYRGYATPGIQKSSSKTAAGNTEIIDWEIKAYNSGTDAMRSYAITDVMMEPYSFTGDVTCALLSGTGGNIVSRRTLFTITNNDGNNISISYTEGEYYQAKKTYTATFAYGESHTIPDTKFGDIRVTFTTASDGRQIMSLLFSDETKGAIPNGACMDVVVNTRNVSGKYENKTYVNESYLTPSANQPFSQTAIERGVYAQIDVPGDDSADLLASVMSQAFVSVTWGYVTSSELAVNNPLQWYNGASSSGDVRKMSLDGKDSQFIYTLSVTNGGSANYQAQNLEKLVLVDNLPEVSDHITMDKAYARNSQFKVDFEDADNLCFSVDVIGANNASSDKLDSTKYTLQFSAQTDLDYGSSELNTKVWNGDTLTADDGWYTLDELASDSTLSLSDMRTVRVVIIDSNDSSIMPAGSTISASFYAKVSGDSKPAEYATAWNSFGYACSVKNGSLLRAAPASVGVQMPGVPYLQKELVSAAGDSYAAPKDSTFTFLIYEGSAVDGVVAASASDTDAINEIFNTLANNNRKATLKTITVPAGKTAAEGAILNDLYTYKNSEGVWEASDEAWQWMGGSSYTVVELIAQGASDYAFESFVGASGNSLTFTYYNDTYYEIRATNAQASWSINLQKTSDADNTKLLSGAKFAIYTDDETQAQTTGIDRIATEISVPDKLLGVGGSVLYLYDVQTTNAGGVISLQGLTGQNYYLVEIEAPSGYAIGDENGWLISAPDEGSWGSTNTLSVVNCLAYNLPKTGGVGTWVFAVSGAALVIVAAIGLALQARRRKARYSR